MTQQRDMKTLAEILDEHSSSIADLVQQYYKHDRVETTEDILAIHNKAKRAIAKELMECLPEKHVCDDSCNIRSNEWEIGHRAYKDAESNVIDEVRARLTAFIGKEVR